MGIRHVFIALCLTPNALYAEDFNCLGTTPSWELTVRHETAQFAFHDRNTALDIMQSSTPEGIDWPLVLTMVGPRDSAIVILTTQTCNGQDYSAHILTQRGDTPIVLTGCCSK